MSEQINPADPIVGFDRHPAAIMTPSVRRPVYRAADALARPSDIPPWSPADRFAPPGPPELRQPVMDVVVPLAAPSPPPVLEREPEAVAPPEPVPEIAPIWEDTADEFAEAEAAPLTAPSNEDWRWPRSNARLQADLPEAGQNAWDVAPLVEPQRSRFSPAFVRRAALAFGGAVLLAAIVFAGVELAPSVFGGGSIEAVYNAPMMVIRAAVAGRVSVVAANAGQMVDPRSPLLTIHTEDPANPDRLVLAGVHGMVRSVETVPGADLQAGAPLVRIHDCDRAFLTIPANTKLQAGDAVQVKLPNLPSFTGTVRPAAGIMEPPNSLVVGLQPGASGGACPVGATAAVSQMRKA